MAQSKNNKPTPTKMESNRNTADNKALSRKFFSYFESGNPDKIVDELLTSHYTLHFPGMPTPLSVQQSRDLMMEYKTAFPDLKFTIIDQYAEGNLVVNRIKSQGTHAGKFQGMQAGNKKAATTLITVHRFENGRIAEEWTEFDRMSMMKQLGMIKEPAHFNHH